MGKKINILLVDDRQEGLVTLEAVLTNPEYNLIKASSGKEALAQVLAHDFAVILLDVQMPEMDGFETAAIIKQREKSRNIPIIFLTAINKADHFVSTGYSVGAVDYIFKPFDSNILKSKVAVFVDLYRKNLQVQEQAEALREVEIRDRMRTLVELEIEGRRRYQNLADAIPQIVFRAIQPLEIEYFNQFWQSYTGQSVKNSVGQAWKSVVHAEDLPKVEQRWQDSHKLEIGFEVECRFRRGQSSDYRWHLLRVVPEFNNLSQLICWIGTATDIHDQKVVQEELITAKCLADAASETKSRFLANMSHEIRTPLGAILGFSELLWDEKIKKKEKLQAIDAIRRNGELLSKIIDEILDLSKLEAGKLEVEKTLIHLPDLLTGVKSFMSLSAKEKGLDFQFTIRGRIPVYIQSNSTRLQQILVNVIGNAIKFTSRGQVLVTAYTDPTQPTKLFISVKDSGPGLTEAQIKHLFKPFTQVDTSVTRRYGGTGLGLAISRKLARGLGGDIEVQSNENEQGSTFFISIDRGVVQETEFISNFETPTPPTIRRSDGHADLLKGIRVLLVEDSVDNQVLVSRFLTLAGANVDLANDGVEGVTKAMSGDHHVVLMDIQMPELDGYSAISQLREGGFNKPIIALTAHGMLEERRACLRVGSNDHLTKPINRQVLLERVHDLAQRH